MNDIKLFGRIKEINILNNAVQDNSSHFIAIYGRRRVGKTFLIRETFGGRFTFQHSGLANAGMEEQLYSFENSIKEAGGYSIFKKSPKNWLQAFEGLKELVKKSSEIKKVLFIDELSWMDTKNSDLLTALENFWNGWASARKDIILIVCASATSWMMSKVIHNKGGLYNRLTDQIPLEPFTLGECEEYIKAKRIALNRNQILNYYMVFGGVPYYWSFIQKGLSVPQNIDEILFAENAPLKDEFKYLYASIFRNPTVHIQIIKTLAQKKAGMTREEIIENSGIINSGDLTLKLEELESCGFIRKFNAFGMKKKGALYQLMDFFTLFYYQFMEDEPTDPHFWSNQINTPSVNTWKGLAFERVCLNHIEKIKNKLGISGVQTDVNSWYCKADLDKGIFGSQIDLLIVRKDQVINLCEMKYSESEYTLLEKENMAIRRRINDLKVATGTKYAIYPTMVTNYGLVENSYAGDIQSLVTADDLFG